MPVSLLEQGRCDDGPLARAPAKELAHKSPSRLRWRRW
jgi:hypothetical protein